DRLLVAVVELHRGFVALAAVAAELAHQADQGQRGQGEEGDRDPDVAEDRGVAERAEGGQRLEQGLAVAEQLVRAGGQRGRRVLGAEQVLRTGQDRVQVLLHLFPLRRRLV